MNREAAVLLIQFAGVDGDTSSSKQASHSVTIKVSSTVGTSSPLGGTRVLKSFVGP